MEFYFEKDIELENSLDELKERAKEVYEKANELYDSDDYTDYSFSYLNRVKIACEALLELI